MKTRKGRPRPDPGCSATDDEVLYGVAVKILSQHQLRDHEQHFFHLGSVSDVAAKLPLYSISTRERCHASCDLQIGHITSKLYVLFFNVIHLN
jgi:hypothetical protein